ncbi:MAG: hypothetical protein BWY06_02483 [Candidatus Latescibacteria bacterium ADurb.Bin168]|jgi:hypothetical protein|nr:MAG: hypothetical protein BWY06_02483 [Candidatus Latescibacteria bacterium ADurb.Bin168]
MYTPISIVAHVLEYQPTRANYSKTVEPVGVMRRTLTGKLDAHVRAVKHRWRITVPEQGLLALLTPFMDGTPIPFIDVDGATYSVVIEGAIPQSGYPASIVGEITLTLVEV